MRFCFCFSGSSTKACYNGSHPKCEQLCLVTPGDPICACKEGSASPSNNNTSCQKEFNVTASSDCGPSKLSEYFHLFKPCASLMSSSYFISYLVESSFYYLLYRFFLSKAFDSIHPRKEYCANFVSIFSKAQQY